MSIRRIRLGAAVVCVLGVCAALGTATAQTTGPVPPLPPAAPVSVIEVQVGASVIFPLPRHPMIINTENPSVATMEVLTDGTARVTGVAVGQTRIVGQDFASIPMIYPVRVVAPGAPARR